MKLGYGIVKQLYQEYLTGNKYSKNTIVKNMGDLNRSFTFLQSKGIDDLREVNEQTIIQLVEYLKNYITIRGTLLSGNCQKQTISVLNTIFTYLVNRDYLLYNPFIRLELKFNKTPSLRAVMSKEEVFTFLESIDISTHNGILDRAIFELLYVTGMRGSEVCNLENQHVDFGVKEIMIVNSKGSKDRIVPLGAVCEKFINIWLKSIRSRFIRNQPDEKWLFVNKQGKKLSLGFLRKRLSQYLKQCQFSQNYVLHSFRHSCATHLLEGGADIRYVQELLGHSSIQTTVVYTNLAVENIKKIYRMYHPRENELYTEVTDENIDKLKKIGEKTKSTLKTKTVLV